MIQKIGRPGGLRSGLRMPGSYFINVKSHSVGDERLELTHYSEAANPLFLVSAVTFGQVILKYSCFYRATITQSTTNWIKVLGSSRGNTFEIETVQTIEPNCFDGNSIKAIGRSVPFNLLDDGRSAFYSEFGGGLGRTVCLKEASYEIYGIITADNVEVYKKSHLKWDPLQVELKKL